MMFFKKHNKILFIALFLILGGLLLWSGLVLAQDDKSSNAIDLGITYGQQTGLGGDDIRLIIARVIRAALGLLGIVVLVIMLYGGYVYMTAAGNEEKVAQAKKILINGIIGLMIILASLSIVQFILSKLQEATIGGTSENCQIEGYAQIHMQECFPVDWNDICKKDPISCCEIKLNENDVFFAKSITPVSEDTRMNNVAGRSILSMPINTQFTADNVLKVKQGDKDITDKFDFSFISNTKNEHVGVEAVYKAGQGLCADGKTPCLDNGKYNLEINKDLTSQSDKKIMEVANEECSFPLSADFTVAHKNKLVLSFDGESNYVDLGTNPMQNGSLTMEAWIFPTDIGDEIRPIVSAGSDQFSLFQQNKNLQFRLGGDGLYCDVIAVDALKLNKWQHVVANYDAFTMRQRIYVDGKFVGQADIAKQHDTCKTISGGEYGLKIGAQEKGVGKVTSKYFSGKISDVCLYNNYLDPNQIQLTFENGLGHCGEAVKDGLKGIWNLNTGFGNGVVNLFSPEQNHGKIIGQPSWLLEPYFDIKPDGFFSFNGTDANIELDSNSTANFKDTFSISLWVRVDGENADDSADYIIDKRQGGSPGSGYLMYYVKSTKSLGFDLRREDVALTFYQPITVGKWYQVVWIYNGKDSKVYLDGELKSTKSAANVKPIIPFSGKLWIGGDQNQEVKNRFKGSVDEIHLYGRILDTTEIQMLSAQRTGPYVFVNENKDLAAGYRFSEGVGVSIADFSGNNHTAKVMGSGYSWAQNLFSRRVIDKVAPFADKIKVGDNIADEEDVYNSGGAYKVNVDLIDNSGIGYGSIKIERETKSKGKENVADSFKGPAVKRIGGSDALPDNPYNLNYILAIGEDLNEIAKYTVNMKVYDIDQNFTSASASFIVQPKKCKEDPTAEGCGGLPGDDCTADWQCDSSKCVEGKCIAQPKILSVNPMNGAEGNYVTIIGKYFGSKKGVVQFGYDDKWVEAKIVDCGAKISWYDKWIIVEVPPDVGIPPSFDLPQGSKSAIKVERSDSKPENPLLDYSNDSFGPKLDLFTKNDKKRPGLCSVVVSENQTFGEVVVPKGATVAPPKTKVDAIGSAFGSGGAIFFGGVLDAKGLMSGGVQAQYTAWTEQLINSQVPTNMKDGVAAVYVTSTSSGEPSNGVPFTILNIADLANDIPVIDQIDPPSTTPKSWITIYGHGFGSEKGAIYLADSAGHAKDCAQEKKGAVCVPLELTLPVDCGNTWSDTQVIAAVPENIVIKKYFLVLKNVDNLYTDGEDNLEVKSGRPSPGICKIEPNFGPAPRPNGDYLNLYGVNFSGQKFENVVYFWQNKADANKVETWLKTVDEIHSAVDIQIETAIPLVDGLSMQTGAIKVGVKPVEADEAFSNSIKYTVTDCREEDAVLKKTLEDQGLQCCAEEGGPESGRWKDAKLMCAGGSRSAGYIWRFTTGKIHQLPKVVEQCNEIDWNNPKAAVEYPSPVPSDLWTKGKETCLNATIAVRFTVPMDGISLKAKDKDGEFANVRVFECSNGEKPDCDVKKVKIPATELDMVANTNILEIRKVPPQVNLKSDTWYHVELSDKIISADCGATGLTKCYQDNLQKTKSCGGDTAYCFDFKTGDENNLCTVENAGIAPPSYTVHLLGLVWNPAYPFDAQTEHPYFYFVWGMGSQECVVLNVDGMGWEWGPNKLINDGAKASSEIAPSKPGEKPTYIDSRAKVWAHENNVPDGTKITASLDKVIAKESVNILKQLTGGSKAVTIKTVDDVFTTSSFKGQKWELDEYYTVMVNYSELVEFDSTSTMAKKPYMNEDKKIGFYWELTRYIYSKSPANKIYVVDRIYDSGKKERGFVYEGSVKLEHWRIFDKDSAAGWDKGIYTIKKGVKDTVLYAGGENDTVADFKANNIMPDNELMFKSSVYLGGQSKDVSDAHLLFGKINSVIVDKTSYLNQSVGAASTLYVDLFNPQVVKWWPNCVEACINSMIGFLFNMPMMVETFTSDNFELKQCVDETCGAFVGGEILLKLIDSEDNLVARFSHDVNLVSSTWYQVRVTTGVRAVGGSNPKLAGKSLEKEFIGKFKTKADDSPCKISSVGVSPNDFLATSVGQKTKYAAIPKSSPDACSVDGQELNPWVFGWLWDSTKLNPGVAEITHFSSSLSSVPGCNKNCLFVGSDISKSAPVTAICGDGNLDAGEDCEIEGKDAKFVDSNKAEVSEKPGITCSYNCLRPGNPNQAVTSTLGYCGNAILEIEVGEECDIKDKEVGDFCSSNCTWAGSTREKNLSDERAPLCGSGLVTIGEDCDVGISLVGCSDNCLHIGSPLAQSWCDSHPTELKDLSQCKTAASVCGNDKIEQGEECEPKSSKEKTCSDKCLFQNICNVAVENNQLKCDPKTIGCAKDCTLLGSSVLYGSLCGNGKVESGEYALCEVPKETVFKYENPVQVVTAIGEGKVDDIKKKQLTNIEAVAMAYWKGKNNWESLSGQAIKTGKGDYALKCGNTEYLKPIDLTPIDLTDKVFQYNDCYLGDGEKATQKGVAKNSCCYERAYRGDGYPANNAMGVCRNTYISVDFGNHIIDAKSLPGNLTIAVGYSDQASDFSCYKIGEKDVSQDINHADPFKVVQGVRRGFWKNLWYKTKGWLVRLVVSEARAEHPESESVDTIWCTGGIKVVPALRQVWSKDLSFVTTTVALYIDTLLPENSTIAVFLRGGVDGIKDNNGIGIRNSDLKHPLLEDVWFFKTGEEICKLKNVTVNPDSQLFDKPTISYTFQAVTESTYGQQIQSIPKQYSWIWDWQPQNNLIFDIPAKGSDGAKDIIDIAARDVEGKSIAVANAKVTEDVDQKYSQVGQVFTGMTNLEAMFCENPWPPKQYFPFEEGISFGQTKNVSWFDELGNFTGMPLPKAGNEYFNFKMRYCADAGKSGETGDDLPYLKPKLFFSYEHVPEVEDGVEICDNEIDDDGDNVIDCLDGSCDGKQDKYGATCCELSGNSVCGSNKLFCDGGGNFETYRCVECEDSSADDCKTLQNKIGYMCDHGVCVKEDCDNNKDDDGDGKIDCEQEECKNRLGFCGLKADTIVDQSLSESTLKRFIFFNVVNDDAIGVQIFKNTARVKASEWLSRNFGQVSGMKSAQIAGYDAVTDGNNYYINALNEASDKKIYNNIYQFSINKNAQQSTRNVFEQLIKSLEFNINISDTGCCLKYEEGVEPYNILPDGIKQVMITDKTCKTDFDCRDSAGVPLDGQNGICSNAKTKLFRDWVRLPFYKTMQDNFKAYFSANAKYPELKSGTFIPGYTVSMWSSWGTLGGIINGLPTDKINKWVGCPDKKADQQTCWNAASSTFSCPFFASVYEYEFVSTSPKYKFHGPLEYFALNSTVAVDFINPNFFTTERGCVPLAVYSPFGAKCGDGVVNVGEDCDPPGEIIINNTSGCKPNLQATKTCTDKCKWSYNDCKPTTACGNGKVEGKEVCDEGALNGSYGHCNKDCGTGEQFCGNGKIDGDTNNDNIKDPDEKWLELCDKASLNFEKGYCKKGVLYVCENDNDCKAGSVDYSPCVSMHEPGYDFIKTRSCSWDCQDYGEYCGDGKVKESLEDCDDKNKIEFDGCNKMCEKENIACKNYPAFFSTSTYPWKTTVNVTKEVEGKMIPIDQCKSTGAQICRAYGFSCETVEKESTGNPVGWEDILSDGKSCEFDLTNYFKNKEDFVRTRVVCDGVYKGPAVNPPVSSAVKTCGNGKQETYKDDKGKDVIEACDMGGQNGIKCVPTYGKSCTFCSSKCDEVLTVDPVNFCGNGKIDVKEAKTDGSLVFEECEEVGGKAKVLINPGPPQQILGEKLCVDKGKFYCNSCKLSDDCLTCGFSPEHDAVADVKFLNVMKPGSEMNWPVDPKQSSYARLFYGNGVDSFKSQSTPIGFNNTYANENSFGFGLIDKINTSNRCNAQGDHYFMQFSSGPTIEADKVFDFPVAGEKKNVVNEYAISPPIPVDGVFRVVVKWTEENKDIDFSGVIYNNGFLPVGSQTPVLYNTLFAKDLLCDSVNYFANCATKNLNGVYVHPRGNLEHTYVQATTIDTNQWLFGTSYAFAVEQFTELFQGLDGVNSITQFLDADLEVEIYAYKPNQDPLSIYRPVQSFTISQAEGTSSNDSARVWHVFDLVYDDNTKKYSIQAVNKIQTDDSEVEKSIPITGGGIKDYFAFNGQKAGNDFFYDKSDITDFVTGDIAFIYEDKTDFQSNFLWRLKVEDGTSFVNFTDNFVLSENEAQNVKICYNSNSDNLADVNVKDTTYLPVEAQSREVYFSRLPENKIYRYVFQFKELKSGQYIPAFIANKIKEFDQGESLNIYFGGRGSNGNLVLNNEADTVKNDVNSPWQLNKFDNANVPAFATQWYALRVKREGNSLFINLVNKFLGKDVIPGNYATFD